MLTIVSDNKATERCLQELVKRCIDCGAEIADEVTIRDTNGSLSIEAPPGNPQKVLIQLPRHALLDISLFHFALSGDDLVLESFDKDLPEKSVNLMKSLIEMYNLTQKIKTHRKTSSLLFLLSQPELIGPINKMRSEPILKGLRRPGMTETGNLVISTFLKSRALMYRRFKDSEAKVILMPIIELLNHAPHGVPFKRIESEDGAIIGITRSAPQPGNERECFAFYGPNDSMDTWLNYNFVDTIVPYTRSVSMDIDLPDTGTIKVLAQGNMATIETEKLPQQVRDLRFYLPNITAKSAEGINVSFLLIPGPGAPRALRRVLHILIMNMAPDITDRKPLVLAAEDKILSTNIESYENLKQILKTTTLKNPDRKAVMDDLLRVCDIQLSKIRQYSSYAQDIAAA